jgi:DNA-binding PadR family transcriptional regulator
VSQQQDTERPNIWRRWYERRLARRETAVLGALAMGDIYVSDIWQRVGGNVGWVYLSLQSLERQEIAWSAWAEQPAGPARRRYGITKKAWDAREWECR